MAQKRNAGRIEQCLNLEAENLLARRISHFDPMYGPAMRFKRFSSSWRQRCRINVSGL
jgi:hypothetical protein